MVQASIPAMNFLHCQFLKNIHLCYYWQITFCQICLWGVGRLHKIFGYFWRRKWFSTCVTRVTLLSYLTDPRQHEHTFEHRSFRVSYLLQRWNLEGYVRAAQIHFFCYLCSITIRVKRAKHLSLIYVTVVSVQSLTELYCTQYWKYAPFTLVLSIRTLILIYLSTIYL